MRVFLYFAFARADAWPGQKPIVLLCPPGTEAVETLRLPSREQRALAHGPDPPAACAEAVA